MQPHERVIGVEKLLRLYGYWPTFHDASVERVILEREGPTITIDFILNDTVLLPDHPQKCILVTATLQWQEVGDVEMLGIDWDENNWIYGLKLTLNGEYIYTVLDEMDGTHGYIYARRLEVLDAQHCLIQKCVGIADKNSIKHS
jgi:hypothetical protein